MKYARPAAIAFLLLVTLLSACAGFIVPASYAHQYRDEADAACSRTHLLGTDDLGRDRFARVLYGTRISLLLAPAAALLTTSLAALVGGTAGFVGGAMETLLMSLADLVLSIPWFFLLITIRALLPLNVAPLLSILITFLLLGALGWAGAARLVCRDAHAFRQSDAVLLARASGSAGLRLFRAQVVPNLLPLLAVQFWLSIPVFILAEANLGALGLGVAEPLPSWGGLVHELEGYSALTARPVQFVPLVLLVATISCFEFVFHTKESSS